MATARAAGSRGGTSRPASGGSPARISRAPPASVPTAGVPHARASTSTRPHGSGSVEGYTRQSRSAMRSPATGPGSGPSQCTPSSRALTANDPAYSSLPATVPPATTTSVRACAFAPACAPACVPACVPACGWPPGPARRRRRSLVALEPWESLEEDVHTLPGVDPADVAHDECVVRQPESLASPPCSTREKLPRVSFLVDDNHVAGVELGSNRCRDRQHALCEVLSQEPFQAQGGARLHDDLPCVPNVRLASEPSGRPSVPAVQRIAVHDIGTNVAGEPPQPDHAHRPGHQVGQPGAKPVARTDPPHR